MLTKEYPLNYWLGRGIFACETHEGNFMEFRVEQLLGNGNSALMKALLELERCGRDMGACRAELTALQQMARDGGLLATLVYIAELELRRDDGYQGMGRAIHGWVWDISAGQWIRRGGGRYA